MFKYYIERVKPIDKEEAIRLFKVNRKNTLSNEGWFKTTEKEKELNSLLESEYDSIITSNPDILNRVNQKNIINKYCSIPESEIERLWDTMLEKYTWVSKDYVIENVNKNAVNNIWVLEFEDEITSISIAS